MAKRLKAMGQYRYRNGFEITLQEDLVQLPLSWKKSRCIFVNSMSDLFHPSVPADYIQKIFNVMERANWHEFQLLTKRSERLIELAHYLPWPKNVWIGVSVENANYINRINHLRSVPAAVRFLSIEPLLGPLTKIPLKGIDWVIVGGESGPKARPIDKEWVRKIRDKCIALGVPFFFKQWGGTRKTKTGRKLDGRTWDEMPLPKKRRYSKRAVI